MLEFGLTSHDRSTLIRPAMFWLKTFSNEETNALSAQILDSFDAWKWEQADADGRIIVYQRLNMLSPSPHKEKRPANEVEPWQANAEWVENDIDLAFKLWLESFEPFASVITDHGHGKVFGLVGLWSAASASASSLIRLNSALVDFMQTELESEIRGRDAWKKAQSQILASEGRKTRTLNAERKREALKARLQPLLAAEDGDHAYTAKKLVRL